MLSFIEASEVYCRWKAGHFAVCWTHTSGTACTRSNAVASWRYSLHAQATSKR